MKRGTAAAWAIGYGYNGNGHRSSLVYPSGLTVSYAPNALGQPTQAGTYATGVSYFPNGAVKQFTYGNGVVHTLTQNARGLPARTTDCTLAGTCASANRRLDLQYAYDQHANVSNITDHTASGRQTRGMSYDALDRLIQTTSPATVFGTASYGYDVLDNLTTVHVSAGSQSRNHTYVYDAATQRLSQVKHTVGGAVVANLSYDVQGNLAGKGTQTYQFDLGNRLRSVPGKETGYEYDGHGRRVYAQTVGSSQIVSQYASAGQLLYQENHKQSKRTDYVYLGGRLVAYRERPLSGSTVTVKYQHVDGLGSPIAVTDAAKNAIESSEYEPYGQLVNKPLFDGPGYTGHVQDAATGLTYMQQRYYDPQIGLFLSVDPVTAYDRPVAGFNRYRYAANNPYKFIDPDGRCEKTTGSGICGGGAGNNVSVTQFSTYADLPKLPERTHTPTGGGLGRSTGERWEKEYRPSPDGEQGWIDLDKVVVRAIPIEVVVNNGKPFTWFGLAATSLLNTMLPDNAYQMRYERRWGVKNQIGYRHVFKVIENGAETQTRDVQQGHGTIWLNQYEWVPVGDSQFIEKWEFEW